MRIATLLAIFLLALGLRFYAASTMRVDVDEPTYLRAAVNYAQFLRQGDWKYLSFYSFNNEHPSFFKLVYGAAELVQPPIPNVAKPRIRPTEPIATAPSKAWILTGRYTAGIFSALAALALAAINPLAGLFLAIQELGIKYTSVFYLEGLPFLTSLLAALAYLAWFRRIQHPGPVARKTHLWLLAAAIFLGMTAAAKYVYLVVGLVMALHYAIYSIQGRFPRQYLYWLLGGLAAALLTFYLLDTYLWKQPFQKLIYSLTFFVHYTGSTTVVKNALPFYQPLIWIFKPYPASFPYDRGSFVINLDVPIAVLAVLGAFRLLKKNSFFFLWLTLGVVTLMAWPTRWVQYALIVIVPLCYSASEGLAWLLSFPLGWLRRRSGAAEGAAEADLDA